MNRPTIADRLRRGETVIGTMICELLSPGACHIAKNSGFDYVIVDTEHNLAGVETVAWMCRVGIDCGLPVLVRAPAFEGQWLSRYLDLGAAGLIVPRIDNASQAEAVVRAVKYPPRGVRGLATGGPHTSYSPPPAEELIRWANDNLLVALQIETTEGLANCDEILAVEGVDAVFVGPGDLSLRLGHPHDFDHPEVVGAIEEIFAAARAHGVAPGIHISTLAHARRWLAAGARFLCYSSDLGLMITAARTALSEIRAWLSGEGGSN
ncbi:MAG: hypothetical protein H5T86_12920 [Armatimonadetes bacterium]|nr:hypothetical protein [Armatimonadota bacterium]